MAVPWIWRKLSVSKSELLCLRQICTALTMQSVDGNLAGLASNASITAFNLISKLLSILHRLPSIGKIIKKYKHLIYNSPSLINIFPIGSIIPAFRRTKNIKEILRKKQHRAPDNQRGCFKCTAKCDLCKNFLKENNCFTSTSTGRTYPITQIISSLNWSTTWIKKTVLTTMCSLNGQW